MYLRETKTVLPDRGRRESSYGEHGKTERKEKFTLVNRILLIKQSSSNISKLPVVLIGDALGAKYTKLMMLRRTN